MPQLLYHRHKEEENKMRAREDNNQHDDVIFWLNAPLGRERESKDGWAKMLVTWQCHPQMMIIMMVFQQRVNHIDFDSIKDDIYKARPKEETLHWKQESINFFHTDSPSFHKVP